MLVVIEGDRVLLDDADRCFDVLIRQDVVVADVVGSHACSECFRHHIHRLEPVFGQHLFQRIGFGLLRGSPHVHDEFHHAF